MILDLHLGMGLYLSFQPCRATFVARGLGGEDWRAGKREEVRRDRRPPLLVVLWRDES
jgi:hypothetical protein